VPPSGVSQRRIRDARVNNSGTAHANAKSHATDGRGWGYLPFAPFSAAEQPALASAKLAEPSGRKQQFSSS
jgi:hypothetical protein